MSGRLFSHAMVCLLSAIMYVLCVTGEGRRLPNAGRELTAGRSSRCT